MSAPRRLSPEELELVRDTNGAVLGIDGGGGHATWIQDVVHTALELGRELRETEEDRAALQALFDLQVRRETLWIERWQQETGNPLSLPDYGDILAWILDKADAAEAKLARVHRIYRVHSAAVLSAIEED
jgi:hypothetical protein